MPEKAANSGTTYSWSIWLNPLIHLWFKVLTMVFFIGILIVWGIDGWDASNFQRDFVVVKLNCTRKSVAQNHEDLNSYDFSVQPNLTFRDRDKPHRNLTHTHLNFTQAHENLAPEIAPIPVNVTKKELNVTNDSPQVSENLTHNDRNPTHPTTPATLGWITAELEVNYSSNLLAAWLAPNGEPCKDSITVDVTIPGLDGHDPVELSTGDIHEFAFQALDDSGKPHCLGGDYFEIDLSGYAWKSRPPIKDLGNGTYTFSVQVHPDFSGNYNLTVILLFRHFQGLKFSPQRFAFDRVLRTIPITLLKSSAQLAEIAQCQKSDLTRDVWSGRWTRHANNESCPISNDGRYRCLEPNFQCPHPWCGGSLALLESNGWTYSTHCSFKLFSSEEAWKCLNNRWIFWWGDSNHCDTVRNILNFILDVQDVKVVPRRADMNITNRNNPSQKLRFTSIFNGHPNDTGNYQGLNSLINEEYRNVLKGYFSQEIVPDAVIMNSGLHDGVYWPSIRTFIKGADYAASFWADVVEGVRQRGLVVPEVIYRTTVATGGYARRLAFNPNKMEAFNGVVLDKLRQYGVVSRVIDDFDMTYPWHFDNRCNDGVHYGRAPANLRWRDGQIGHQYFVDLMLGHVLLNALCAR